MIKSVLIIITVVFAQVNLYAQFTPTNGPYGGLPYSIASDGINIYVGTYGGILKSSNDGVTWSNVSSGLPQGTIVNTLCLFNTKIFAGTYDGIYVSDDGGSTWSPSNNGYTVLTYPDKNILTIYAVGNKLFLGTTTGVYVSNDEGALWQPSNLGMPFTQVNEYRVINSYLFAATQIGVFKSEDQGLTWYSVNNGISNTTIYSVTSVNNVVVVGTQQGAYKSIDFGASWTSITSGMGVAGVISVAAIGNYLYMGTGVLYRSADIGSTWVNISNGINGSAHAIIEHLGKIVCAAASMYISSNNLQSWNNIGLGQSNYVNDMITYNNKLLCVTGNGIYSTVDYGDTWLFDPTNQMSNSNIIAIEKSNNSLFVSLNDGGIYKSIDGGLSWILSGLPLIKTNVLRTINGKIYAGTTFQGLYVSVDNGLTWNNISNGLPTNFSVYDITFSNQVIAIGTTAGIYISTNNGVNWISASVGYTGAAYSASYNDVSNLFYAAALDIYKSTNSCTSWELSYDLNQVGSAWALKSIVNNTFAGTSGNTAKVYKTTDGASWQVVGQIYAQGISDFEHQNEVLYASVFNPHSSGKLNGVWRASNGILNTEEELNDVLNVYPNPVNQVITIEVNENILGQNISVKNTVGIKMLEFTTHEFINQIDVSNLPSGVYFIGLTNPSAYKQYCFIKY
jgi:photosystem II stability/assembly factor-like uncharacterized protein